MHMLYVKVLQRVTEIAISSHCEDLKNTAARGGRVKVRE